jgi:uncharacterized protein (UPF0548 family)
VLQGRLCLFYLCLDANEVHTRQSVDFQQQNLAETMAAASAARFWHAVSSSTLLHCTALNFMWIPRRAILGFGALPENFLQTAIKYKLPHAPQQRVILYFSSHEMKVKCSFDKK